MRSVVAWPLLLGVLLAQGCAGTRVGSTFRDVEQGISRAALRTADAFGVLPRPHPMIARTAASVRSGPNVMEPRVGVLLPGDQAPVVGRNGGWYRIRYAGGHGWVASDLLADASEKPTSIANSAVPKEKPAKAAQPPAQSKNDGAVVPVAVTTSSASRAPIEVAGIPFRWGMSRTQASEAYASAAERVEDTGAIWVRTAALPDGTLVPEEWIDLRFCGAHLCAIRRVLNAVGDEHDLGDRAATELNRQFGSPATDTWKDTAFGRMRERSWRTATANVRLTHQDDQTYATIEYSPVARPGAPQVEPSSGGRIAAR